MQAHGRVGRTDNGGCHSGWHGSATHERAGRDVTSGPKQAKVAASGRTMAIVRRRVALMRRRTASSGCMVAPARRIDPAIGTKCPGDASAWSRWRDGQWGLSVGMARGYGCMVGGAGSMGHPAPEYPARRGRAPRPRRLRRRPGGRERVGGVVLPASPPTCTRTRAPTGSARSGDHGERVGVPGREREADGNAERAGMSARAARRVPQVPSRGPPRRNPRRSTCCLYLLPEQSGRRPMSSETKNPHEAPAAEQARGLLAIRARVRSGGGGGGSSGSRSRPPSSHEKSMRLLALWLP